MNAKQRNILNSPDLGQSRAHPDNQSEKSEDFLTSGRNTEKTTKDALVLQLKKLEDVNAQLEELVQESTNKLADAVTTNARFLSIVAHDLRNPFSTTIGILDLLNGHLNEYDEIEIERLINIASTSAVRSLKLVENLLSWSMTQNKEKTFNPIKINLRELVITELESFNTSALLKKLELDHSIDHGMFLTADFQMVKTIFRNLISNAIKYSHPGGKIFISATELKKFVEIEVRDNGIGMSKKTCEKLFKIDEFHSRIGTNNEMGTGLGLMFCKEFIDLHGGEIHVESEPGKGSRFIFTLPHYI